MFSADGKTQDGRPGRPKVTNVKLTPQSFLGLTFRQSTTSHLFLYGVSLCCACINEARFAPRQDTHPNPSSANRKPVTANRPKTRGRDMQTDEIRSKQAVYNSRAGEGGTRG